jgi:hypothetical protein
MTSRHSRYNSPLCATRSLSAAGKLSWKSRTLARVQASGPGARSCSRPRGRESSIGSDRRVATGSLGTVPRRSRFYPAGAKRAALITGRNHYSVGSAGLVSVHRPPMLWFGQRSGGRDHPHNPPRTIVTAHRGYSGHNTFAYAGVGGPSGMGFQSFRDCGH